MDVIGALIVPDDRCACKNGCDVTLTEEVFNAHTVSKTGKNFFRRNPGKGKAEEGDKGIGTGQLNVVAALVFCLGKKEKAKKARGRIRECPSLSMVRVMVIQRI